MPVQVQFRLKGAAEARGFFGPLQRGPTLHVYPSGGADRVAVVVPVTLAHFSEWSTVVVNGAPQALCFDVYVEVVNDRQRWCRMHAASATLDFGALVDGSSAAPLTNVNSAQFFGELECRVAPGQLALVGAGASVPASDAERLAQREETLFRGMTPSDPFLRRVNAPYFRGRCGVMPGPAYFAAVHDTVAPTDAWWRGQLQTVARRRGTAVADWALAVDTRAAAQDLAPFHKACQLVFEAVSAAVTSYPYCGDFFVDGKIAKPFESFDNFFVREAGDCEDASRAVLQLVTHLQENTANPRTTVGRMASVAKLYAPCAVLGMVSAVAWGHEGAPGTAPQPQAHMFTKAVPLAQLMAKAGCEYTPAAYEPELKTWCIEATAPVEPFTDVASAKLLFASNARRYERTRATQTLPLKSMQRIYRPSLVQQVECSFYKQDVHIYTPTLVSRADCPNVAAFSLKPDAESRTWGVDFESVMTGDYALMPHLDYSAEEVDSWAKHFEREHPPVHLTNSGKPRPLPLGFTPAGPAREQLYSDYVVGDADALSPADWSYARDWFDKQGVHEACWEGWDSAASAQLRVRVYK